MGAIWLEVTKGPAAGERLDVHGDLALGRSSTGPAALGGDPELSRRHARFQSTTGGRLTVEDLGSVNGTLVNGRRLEGSAELRAGDTVQLGNTTLEVRADEEATRIRQRPAAQATRIGAASAGADPGDGDAARSFEPARPAEPPRPAEPARPAEPPRPPGPSRQPVPAGEPVRSRARSAGRRPGPPRRDPRVALLAVLLALAVAGLIVALVTRGGTSSSASDGVFNGTVYVLSNRPSNAGNSVFAFRYAGPTLAPLRLREYPTGGRGSYGFKSDFATDGDQQVWTDASHKLMFAVNQGSDSVAVFHIATDGTLSPVKGSPFPSGGIGPISVGVSGSTVLVVNKAIDGIRHSAHAKPNVAEFHINSDGSLTRIGSPFSEPAGANPGQVWIDPTAKLAVVDESSPGVLATLTTANGSSFKPGPTTTVTKAELRFGSKPKGVSGASPRGGRPTGPGFTGLLGIIGQPIKRYLYVSVASLSELLVYSYDLTGKLTFVKGLTVPNGFLTCWSAITPDGHYLYLGVTSNDTVAAFDVSKPASPRFLQSFKLAGQGHTFNLEVDNTGKQLFVVSTRGSPVGAGNELHVLRIGSDGRLVEPSNSPVYVPVGNSATTFGLVVVPHS